MDGNFGNALPFFDDAVSGTVVQIKDAYGQLVGLRVLNLAAVAAYLQVFAKPAASVVLGTDVPAWCIRLTPNEAAALPLRIPFSPSGGTGLSLAATTTPGGSVGTPVSVSALYL